jgi:hypothetical protein
MNNRGDIVYMGDLSTPPDLFTVAGIFAHSGGSTVAIARPGDPMPGGGTIVTVNPAFSNGNYSINNGGDISFNAALDHGESGLYVKEQANGALRVVARTGTTIPGVGTIGSVTPLFDNGGALNDSGQVFFLATLTDGSGVLLVATPRP